MSHGITTASEARRVYRLLVQRLDKIRDAAHLLVMDADHFDSETFSRLAEALPDELSKALFDSSLEVFAADLEQALETWDGEQAFGPHFDGICRVPVV